jgi:hypothetical protein
VARARAIGHGFHGTAVLWACNRPDCTTSARILHANLAAIGISLRIVQLDDPFGEAQKPGATYDMLLSSWYYDWADPYEVLNMLLDPNGFRPDWAPRSVSIPASYRRELEHVALLRGPERLSAYRRLAVKLERKVAPFAAYSTPVLPEFYSARVACRVEQPVVGAADIGTLCIRKH